MAGRAISIFGKSSSRRLANNVYYPPLQVRGGGGGRGSFSHLPSSPSDIDMDTIIDREAKASLSIVGNSVTLATLGDQEEQVPYLNTKECQAFRVLFVLGGPGAGKGTQSDLMKEHYPCVHLSAGELLRAETTKDDSPHKELIENCLVSGNIVPVEISLSLLETAMKQAAQEHGSSLLFLVDGFPRNFDNLNGWIRCMSGGSGSNNNNQVATVWGILNYQCPLEELERRILDRAKDSGRSDDNLQSARKRFATFERETVPVVKTLRKVQDMLRSNHQPSLQVFDIRGDQTIEEVWKGTQQAMNQMISYDVLTAQAQLFESIDTQNSHLYRQLCADEWFVGDDGKSNKSPGEVMMLQEGSGGTCSTTRISNVKVSFIAGTKVAVEYDRVFLQHDNDNVVKVQEKRIWSHQGKMGWKNIHFARLPAEDQ